MLNEQEIFRVKSHLKRFDCSDREIEIYIKSLQLGPSSIQEISKSLNMNRVTVHSAAEQLIKKGLLTETRKGKRRLILAEDPKALKQIIQTKLNELKQMETNIGYIAELLSKIKSQDTARPTVKFYEGVSGLKKMLEETLEAQGEVLLFSYVQQLADAVHPDYLEDYVKRRAKKGITTRLIFPKCKYGDRLNKKTKEYKITIKVLPEKYHWAAGFFSWNNKVGFLSYTEGKRTVTIIENKDIAVFIRQVVFEIAWDSAKPYK
jgi:sugar-specific transcriptional regulator TrmB